MKWTLNNAIILQQFTLYKTEMSLFHVSIDSLDNERAVVKVVLWSRGAHLTKSGWSKPHTNSNPTNLALFRHKITLYRFNQGGSYYCRGAQMGAGAEPPNPLTLTTVSEGARLPSTRTDKTNWRLNPRVAQLRFWELINSVYDTVFV